MSKKLEANGLWESSRMMLPEHREEILKGNNKILTKKKPLIHDEEVMIFSRAIGESYMREETITLVLYNEFEDIQRTGIVTKIDQHNRRIKLQYEDDFDWIRIDDIVKVIC